MWERSEASRRLKHLRGNPDAVASAYALYDYVVAADLGGPEALEDLRRRAWARGLRLASDMVPNHVGIDGRWVIEHPDWFLSLPQAPYPGYSFTGPDLSSDPRVGIQIEDHYWDGTDAAVVFRRLDRHTGEERFIYHGNDGTSMPWNDTAQLNYLLPEVREAVIRTILHVARQFPIIRFDAAMTLARQHVQRLWFPAPGTGGAIPSRSAQGMTDEEFARHMPDEFWREVVDRVAAEAPDTLLLAEAFWMLEGYFVRTLGMHRVYNSAFMHMTSQERNADYRRLMRNVLEFDPEILKRYVNFMNNPDEETAAAQFGTGDKYFGVCTLMCTLPGPADVRPRPGRGVPGALRHGVPPGPLGRAARRGPGGAAPAGDLPAAAPAAAVRRGRRVPALRGGRPRGGGGERLRLQQPGRGPGLAGGLQQPATKPPPGGCTAPSPTSTRRSAACAPGTWGRAWACAAGTTTSWCSGSTRAGGSTCGAAGTCASRACSCR